MVMVAEQPRVVAWEFDASGARPASTKHNVLAAISDGQSVAKVTIYEEFSSKFQEGRSYVLKGHSLRGQSPPYIINISRETMFFRSAPIQMSEALTKQAEDLIRPISLLTPLRSCSEARDLVTVEGEVIELSSLKKITKGKDIFPMRNIKLQQLSLCLWREVSVKQLQIGARMKVSHLKASKTDYGLQLQSTNFSTIEVQISDSVSQHLSQLAEKVDDYFPEDPRDGHMWILDPFSVDPTEEDVALPSHLESQLLEVSTESTLKLQWGKLDLGSFWIAVSKEYPCLALRAVKHLLPFTTTYLCESGFSSVATTKTKARNRLRAILEATLRVSLSPIPPRLDLIVSERQAQVSH
ncbi:hypothetical protein VZT92_005790 [Zoarces viviparus]|uniref:Uncharacterized protein n=2 Tax=Zoarces viviparus TaxID=48416 RepID=A0AAW1FP90_ZOAVI